MTIFQKIFGNSTRMKIIEFFLEHPVHEFTTKQIAKYIGLSYHSVHRNIKIINKDCSPFNIFEWCGTDRIDKWKLDRHDVVAREFLTILTLDTLRKINKD